MSTEATVAAREESACCMTPVTEVLSAAAAEQTARVFKALGDPTRLRLLSLIINSESGEACVCDLTSPIGLSQGTISHHMKLLVEAGLVTREQRGKWAHYAVDRGALRAASLALGT